MLASLITDGITKDGVKENESPRLQLLVSPGVGSCRGSGPTAFIPSSPRAVLGIPRETHTQTYGPAERTIVQRDGKEKAEKLTRGPSTMSAH